jgi:hypothetical protein
MRKLRYNTPISIQYEKNGEEYSMHGIFKDMDDEFVRIKGTVGEQIGRMIMIPKNRIISIEYKENREE